MVFLSLVISFVFVYILTGSFSESLIILPFSFIFHSMFKPDWAMFSKVIFFTLLIVPKAIFEGFEVLFLKNERIEVLKCKQSDRIKKIISITLTPKSIVIMVDKENLHIHRMVRR